MQGTWCGCSLGLLFGPCHPKPHRLPHRAASMLSTLTPNPNPTFRTMLEWTVRPRMESSPFVCFPPFSCSLCRFSKDVSRHNYSAKYYCQSLSDRLIILWVLLSEASP